MGARARAGAGVNVKVLPDAGSAALAAARFLAGVMREALRARGRCALACSGGSDPWEMYRALAAEDFAWDGVHIVQVDERVVAPASDARNWKHLQASLGEHAKRPLAHPMPVDDEDLDAAALRYARELAAVAGVPPILDAVHLGLGPDGHTASLIPGDAVLDVRDRDVAVTQPYQGHRRMTLTYPALDRARCRVWLVTGGGKSRALRQLIDGDTSVPAGRVNARDATVFTEEALLR
jgi:6-phosphogluconolactonase